MNWCTIKECYKCYGQLRIYESNIYFEDHHNCFNRIDYYTICDNCNSRINLPIDQLTEDVRNYALTNFHPSITLSTQPSVIKNEYSMTHLNCRSDREQFGPTTHSVVNINNFHVYFTWTPGGICQYNISYVCPRCETQIFLAQIREDETHSTIPDRYKYVIYQNYPEIIHYRRKSRKRRNFLRCLTLGC